MFDTIFRIGIHNLPPTQYPIGIYVDEEVVRKAKEIGLNISKISEDALKEVIEKILSSNLRKGAGPLGFEPRLFGSEGRRLYPGLATGPM